jgi:hypothetical protein
MISANSLVAFFGIQPRLGRKQREVLTAIQELGACSDREIARHLNWEINRITNRRGELLKKHLIVRLDGVYKNEYGYQIDKWKLNPNYKFESKEGIINKMNLESAQPKLVYMVGGKKVVDGKLV